VIVYGIDETKNNANANYDIKNGEEFTFICLRREITVPNSGKCYHRKVYRINPTPTFKKVINNTAKSNDETGCKQQISIIFVF
jgi:hypothetical protein